MLMVIEYVPHIFIGAAGLIVFGVMLDFAISRLRKLSARLTKVSRGTTYKESGRGNTHAPEPMEKVVVDCVTTSTNNAAPVSEQPPGEPVAIMQPFDAFRASAQTERDEPVNDTERCEAVASLEPSPESSPFATVGERAVDSRSLVALAASKLKEARVVSRDPSVRVLDAAVVPGSERRVLT